jgi:hypothetical protein
MHFWAQYLAAIKSFVSLIFGSPRKRKWRSILGQWVHSKADLTAAAEEHSAKQAGHYMGEEGGRNLRKMKNCAW